MTISPSSHHTPTLTSPYLKKNTHRFHGVILSGIQFIRSVIVRKTTFIRISVNILLKAIENDINQTFTNVESAPKNAEKI